MWRGSGYTIIGHVQIQAHISFDMLSSVFSHHEFYGASEITTARWLNMYGLFLSVSIVLGQLLCLHDIASRFLVTDGKLYITNKTCLSKGTGSAFKFRKCCQPYQKSLRDIWRFPIPTNTYEYLRILTNTHEFLRIPTNTDEYLPIPTNTNQYLRTPMNTYENLPSLTNTYEYIRILTNSYEHLPIPTNTYPRRQTERRDTQKDDKMTSKSCRGAPNL